MTFFLISVYLVIGWLFARQFQKSSELDPHQLNHALSLLVLMLIWPLAVISMLIVMSMIILFPRIKK